MKKIAFVTLFPDWIRSSLGQSILARAEASGIVEFSVVNPRNFCYDQHKKVDDTPYGGHPGMLIKAEPVALAIENVLGPSPFRRAETGYDAFVDRVSDAKGGGVGVGVSRQDSGTPIPALPPPKEQGEGTKSIAIVITEPSGTKFEQPQAEELAHYDEIIFVCGHYEGIDHRIEETFATHIFSIGDYVLTNGELPALVMADAVTRLIPGVLGNENSLDEESFQNNLLGAPNYTRPEVWRGISIPEVLKNGNHKLIDQWRLEQAKKRTKERRPDLLKED